MQNQDEKELEAMLAAYLDGELAEEENRALARRMEAGDSRLRQKLTELELVRSEAKKWCNSVMKEAESFNIDIWPKLEACLRAEQAQPNRVSAQRLLRALGFSRNLGTASSVGYGRGSFGRGFSFGFAGGLTAAGCAAALIMLTVQQKTDGSGIIGGRTSLPLASLQSENADSKLLAKNSPHAENATGGEMSPAAASGSAASGVPGSNSGAESTMLASALPESAVRVARDRRNERDQSPLAFVSSGRDGSAMNQLASQMANQSVNELAFANSIYRLPSDLFGLQRGIPVGRETFSSPQYSRQLWASSQFSPPETNRERELLSEAFSMQLLNPAGINPQISPDNSALRDQSPADLSSADSAAGTAVPSGTAGDSSVSAGSFVIHPQSLSDQGAAARPSAQPEAMASLSLPAEGISNSAELN